ncbi:MAG: histidine phosphatase family protein [Silicimonas sp.]|jgi:phosphohistidine phosphatase|nr:histidine phosphatase family protein [Silicimonas sp.]
MALTLILMRHAKSDWGDPSQDDFDRPLNNRGRRSASAIGRWLAKQGYLPDKVLVSGARRTVETWECMAGSLPGTAVMESAPVLYLAEPGTILNVLRGEDARTVMMIGHNPGFAFVASALAERLPGHDKFSQYPTAATTVFEFPASTWSAIEPGTGTVLDFVVPRDLPE